MITNDAVRIKMQSIDSTQTSDNTDIAKRMPKYVKIGSKNVEIFEGTIEGKIVKGCYKIGRYLDSGSNGTIYEAVNIGLKNGHVKTPIVVKVQEYDK